MEIPLLENQIWYHEYRLGEIRNSIDRDGEKGKFDVIKSSLKRVQKSNFPLHYIYIYIVEGTHDERTTHVEVNFKIKTE